MVRPDRLPEEAIANLFTNDNTAVDLIFDSEGSRLIRRRREVPRYDEVTVILHHVEGVRVPTEILLIYDTFLDDPDVGEVLDLVRLPHIERPILIDLDVHIPAAPIERPILCLGRQHGRQRQTDYRENSKQNSEVMASH